MARFSRLLHTTFPLRLHWSACALHQFNQQPARVLVGVRTKAAVQIADVLTDQDYPHDHPLRSAAERVGVRTLLCVPMIKKDELIGAISIFRQEVRPFTDRQIELVQSFAAQAVIAIENARLLNELRQRTTDLGEALEQQTGASEVLQVISSSTGEVEPVFESLLRTRRGSAGPGSALSTFMRKAEFGLSPLTICQPNFSRCKMLTSPSRHRVDLLTPP